MVRAVVVLWKDLCTSHSKQEREYLVVQPMAYTTHDTGGGQDMSAVAEKTG